MYNASLKIGVLGSGVVGQLLAKAFLTEGHEVMLGSRNTRKDQMLQWKEDNRKGNIGTYAETAAFGDLLVLATKGAVIEDVINEAGIENFSNKTVIDTTNPIADKPPVNGVLKFFTDLDHSLMEKIQELLPKAHIVKAFNSVGNALMYRPDFGGVKPTMFICGNNEASKKTVTDLLEKFGWEAEDLGKVEAARAIEPLCILWCIPGMLRNDWTHAFKLLKSK
jgi:8-hydroxy-5-deazaflavin:NADPH oxidoreductase